MIECTRHLRPLALALGAAVLMAAPLRAQDALLVIAPSTPASTVAERAALVPAGPTVAAATVAVRRAAPETVAAPAAAGQGRDRGTALMIVGGAAVLTGLVIQNTAGYAISVAGAVIGLYGLYQYLQ